MPSDTEMDTKKVASASKALKKYLAGQEPGETKSQLFEDDGEFVYLVLKSKKFFAEERTLKPKLVELPSGLWKHRTEKPAICAFVRDPQRSYKDVLLDNQTPIKRCIGVSKLKGKFKPYEARRALRSDFDIFVSDDDVVPMLPKLLGKSFYDKQQYVPIPLKMKTKGGKIDAEKVGKNVASILNSTVLIYPASQTMLVRIGTTHHSDKEISENAKAVANAVGLQRILSLSICTSHSPTLPVYYVEKIYSESDIGEEDADDGYETEGQKRKREDEHLDALLAEVVDEDDIKEYNRNLKRQRKQKASLKSGSVAEESTASVPEKKPEDGHSVDSESTGVAKSEAKESGDAKNERPKAAKVPKSKGEKSTPEKSKKNVQKAKK